MEAQDICPDAGVTGAVSFYYDRPDKIHMAGHKFIWWLGIQRPISKIESKVQEIQSVSGCCMLIRKAVIDKIGLLDERFFAYYEESDFCIRAKMAGFKVISARDAKVWHKINKVLGEGTPKEYYIYTRNQPLFMIKNCHKVFLIIFFILYFLKVFLRTGGFFVIGKTDISRAILSGFADFFKGNFGEGRLFAK